jgi:hypothetical protein
MRSHIVSTVAVSALAVGFLAGRVLSQEEPAAPAEASEEAVMKVLEERRALTDEHRQLAAFAGEWDLEVLMFHSPGEPQRSHAKSSARSLLGGRYVVEEIEGDFFGMQFQGLALSGYDKQRGKWVASWVDNYSTAIQPWEGTMEGAVLTMTAPSEEWMGQVYTPKSVTRHLGADHLVYEHFAVLPEGQEWKKMEIRYTRRGAEPLADWTQGPPPAEDE